MKELFGILPTGEKIYKYTIKDKDATAEFMEYGAVMLGFKVCGVDIVGSFDTLQEYITNPGNIGITVGRVANRIKDGLLTIDGETFELTKNQGGNCLHGGSGFGHKVWDLVSLTENSISFSYDSPDGEDGFPGRLISTVKFTLKDNALIIEYEAKSDKKTAITLTNHSYFNLDGIGGDIKDHTLKIYANEYTEVDERLLPTGNHPSVLGTRFDLREARRIGDGLLEGKYDHNFILSPTEFKEFSGKKLGLDCELENDALKLSVYSDQPGLQVYSGNGLGKEIFKGGIQSVRFGAICLETQTEPNSANHGVGIYDAGDIYTHTCVYKVDRKA